jgi:nitrous oxide reductase
MAHEEQSDGTGISRRKLIVTSATLAAAGVAVGAAGASVVSSAVGGTAVASSDSGTPGEGEPVMVYLKNRDSGQFEVYVGDRHAAFADRSMAAQVIDAANRAE